MAEACEFGLRGPREAILDEQVAAGEGVLRKAGSLERGLNVHLEIDDIRDELRVGLRLIPTAHDAEGDAYVAVLRECRDDGVERALVSGQRVGRSRVEREQAAAILQRESSAGRDDSRAESGVVALNQRHHVAIAID